MKKRILCAALAAMTAMSMAACNSSNTGASSGSGSTPSSSTAGSGDTSSEGGSSETASEGSSETAAASPAIDMEGDPYHCIMMYLNLSEGDGYNEVASAVNDLSLTEINMETELVPVSYGTWTTTLNMMLASNEPLDLFMSTASNLSTYIQSGYIADWSEHLDQLPDVVAYYGDELQAGYVGDFMAMIGVVRQRTSNFGLVARKDVMDELGYTVGDFSIDPNDPSTYDKLDEMFAAVKEAHPDMTAVAGQQGLGYYVNGYCDNLSDGFGVLEDYGQAETVTNWYESQQYKDMVTIAKRWYDAGYYSSDAVTSQDTGETLLKAGNLFSFIVGTKPNTDVEKSAQCGYEVVVIPLMGTSIYTTNGYTAMGYSLANASEDKAKAAAYYNWAFTSEALMDLLNWGIEGVDWVEDENGQAAYPDGMDGSNYRYHNDLGFIYPNQTAGHAWAGNAADIWDQYKEEAENALKSRAFGFTYDSTNVTDQVIACTAVNEQYSKTLYFGAVSDVDTAIAEYNSALYDAGLQAIIDEKQAQLDAWLAQQ